MHTVGEHDEFDKLLDNLAANVVLLNQSLRSLSTDLGVANKVGLTS